MKWLPALAAAAALSAAAMPAAAGIAFTLDFEKAWDYAQGDIDGYYGGGTAADGTSGPNVGVRFVNVSGLSNDSAFTYYSNAPTAQGVAYAYAIDPSQRSFMNVAGGVTSALSFFYSSPVAVAGAVQAWSGLNGTGTLLGSLSLAATDDAFGVWRNATFGFAGTALSFDLTGSANVVAFDQVSAVPEPSTALAFLIGGAGLAGAVRRRRVAARR